MIQQNTIAQSKTLTQIGATKKDANKAIEILYNKYQQAINLANTNKINNEIDKAKADIAKYHKNKNSQLPKLFDGVIFDKTIVQNWLNILGVEQSKIAQSTSIITIYIAKKRCNHLIR